MYEKLIYHTAALVVNQCLMFLSIHLCCFQPIDGPNMGAESAWNSQSHRFVYVNSDGTYNDPLDISNHDSYQDNHQEEPPFQIEQNVTDEAGSCGLNGV